MNTIRMESQKAKASIERSVEKKNSFSDKEVVQLSQRLDRYILMAQSLLLN
ncbi:aspartyl-phosphate phosphatase Spo0E family protein [Paenibacillus oleatilyticus]